MGVGPGEEILDLGLWFPGRSRPRGRNHEFRPIDLRLEVGLGEEILNLGLWFPGRSRPWGRNPGFRPMVSGWE